MTRHGKPRWARVYRRFVAGLIVAALALAAPLGAASAGHIAAPERPVHAAGGPHGHGADAGDGGHGPSCSPATCHGLAVPADGPVAAAALATTQRMTPVPRRASTIALQRDPPVPRG